MDKEGNISAAYLADIRKIGGAKAEEAVLAALKTTKLEAGLRGDDSAGDRERFSEIFGGSTSPEERDRLRQKIAKGGWSSLSSDERKAMGTGAQAAQGLQSLSIAEQRALAERARQQGHHDLAEEAGGLAGQNTRNMRSLARGNVGLAGALGVDLSNQEKRRLQGMSRDKAIDYLARQMSLSTGEGAADATKGKEEADTEVARAQSDLNALGKKDPGRAAAQARLSDAQRKAKEAGDLAASTEKGSALREKLEGLKGLKGEEYAKRLTEIQNSPEYQQKLQEKKQKEDANNPVVKGLADIAKALDPLKGVLTTGFSQVTEAINEKGGSGGNAKPPPATSDERLKENIEPLPDPLALLEDLHGYQYTWKDRPEDGKDVGVLAQEVEKVLPEAVVEVDGVKQVYYHKLVPVLLEAVKVLLARVAELEKKEG